MTVIAGDQIPRNCTALNIKIIMYHCVKITVILGIKILVNDITKLIINKIITKISPVQRLTVDFR